MVESKKLVSISLLVLFLALGGTAADAEETGGKYVEAIEKIDNLVQEEIKRNNIQGLSIGLVDGSGLFWSKGYGYEDKKNKVKASAETLYRIASVTKPLTATGVLVLVDRGLVNLDAPIKKYIPEFSIKRVDEKTRPITVRDLLTHHSGLKRDHYKGINVKNPPDLGFLVDELKDDYLALPTGTLYKYSNLNYALLGLIIENVTGKSYSGFMEDEIFRPLGMDDTFVGYEDPRASPISKSYEVKGFLFKRARKIDQYPLRDLPAGGVVSSVEETARFVRMILNHGRAPSGERIVSRDLLEESFTVQYPENELDDDPYGLGWKVSKVPIPGIKTNIRHGGTLNGFSTLVTAAPEERLGVVVFYNTNHVFSRHYIANRALQLLAKAKSGSVGVTTGKTEDRRVPLDSVQLEKYPGKYVGIGDIPLALDIELDGDRPMIDLTGQRLSLKKINDYRYRVSKKILFFDLNVGSFMGVDDVFFDFYRSKRGTVYPRLILEYQGLEMKIFFERISPYKILPAIARLEGNYVPAKESLPYLDDDSFGELELRIRDGWITMNTSWEGTDLEFLLRPLDEGKMRAVGSGEVLEIKGNKLEYSGLVFKKK